MAAAEDRRDRKEARQLMLAVGVAVILLALLLGGALHFLADWFTGPGNPFSGGLGLKDAALISFGVSLAVVLVMAIVSGGDAIFGELPFTIIGFLLFFVIFWLMTAWIF
jgi:hypothetical protein